METFRQRALRKLILALDGVIVVLSMGLAFGPVGGGTVHKSFVMDEDTGRVKFTARDGDAIYDELWLERADGALYDAPVDGEVAYENLFAMGMADASGNGKQDYAVVQVADTAEDLLANRDFMRQEVCGQHKPIVPAH